MIYPLAGSILDALTAGEPPHIPDLTHIENANQQLDTKIWLINIFKKAKMIILEGQLLAEDNIKKAWWAYLHPLWQVLKMFKKNNCNDTAQWGTTHCQGQGLQLFSLLPLTVFHQQL